MHVICVLLAWLAAPFWETTPARGWTSEKVQFLLNDSPWAQALRTQVGSADLRVHSLPRSAGRSRTGPPPRQAARRRLPGLHTPGRLPECGAGHRLQGLDRARRRRRVAPDAG